MVGGHSSDTNYIMTKPEINMLMTDMITEKKDKFILNVF